MYPWRRILVPTDFSTAAEWVFDTAARVAQSTDAELLVLHVRMTWADHPEELRFPVDPSLYDYVEQHELEVLRTRASEAHAVARPRLVVRKAPDPGKEIVRAAQDEEADLIVIATHARHHVAHLLMGSTTLDVINSPPMPVLAVRYGTRKREALRKLVVPVHLRQTTDAAARLAKEIALHQNGEIHLVMVCSDAEAANAEKLLDDLSARVLPGMAVKRSILRGHDVEKEILHYAREVDADAVFLNAEGAPSESKVDIIRHSPVPVMIVP